MTSVARVAAYSTPNLFREAQELPERQADVALLVQGSLRRLPTDRWMKIGSKHRSAIRIDDPHVSSEHALVRRRGSYVEVLDCQSTNGVWLRGQRYDEVRLELGEVFFIGKVPVLVVEVGFSSRFPEAFCWRDMVLMPNSSAMLERVAQIAVQPDSVMINGESGTGKEHVARAIHSSGNRCGQPFVALNCAALPDNLAEGELFGVHRGAFTGADRTRPGLFERATGGTLFLDEVGELSSSVQSKLLRVLETQTIHPLGSSVSRKVDVRIIAATWRDLGGGDKFRHDLHQRLNVLPVHLKPLRSRPEEIGPLLEYFLRERRALHLWPHEDLLRELSLASWHGNIRELRNRVIRSACSMRSEELRPSEGDLSLRASRRGSNLLRPTDDRIRMTLDSHRGNRSATARELGISRSTLYRRLQRSG